VSAPLIWIGLPGICALILLAVMRRSSWATGLAAGICLLLALLAWQMPIDTTIQIGPLAFKVSSAVVIFGRRFVLDDADKAFLTLVYSLGFIWFFGANFARPGRLFWPVGLGMITLLVAAQAVEPFLYAALLIEMAVLLSIPMLNPPGKAVGQGSLRYLIMQTLAVPFILLAGWASTAIEASPNDPRLLLQAAVFLGLGFAIWLAVFPFYTWIPLLTGESHPYASGFVLSFVPGVVFFMALGFMDNYTWLRDNPNLPTVFQLVGALMVVTGGIWAAFQQDLKRAFGYAVILESGFALIALGLHTTVGLEAFATALVPRFLALVLFSFSLSLFEQAGVPTTLEGLKGSLRRMPFASGALLIAYFSLGGLPLLAEFPIRQAIIGAVAGQSIPLMAWILVGSGIYWSGGFRLLATMANAHYPDWKIGENWFSAVLCSAGILVIVLIGLLPGVLLPGLLDLIQVYAHLKY
jgi:NADH-quinone oxidoreductase subunit N